MSVNVKIDNSGAGVAQARIGSILYVGSLGQLKEDWDFLRYDDATQTFTAPNFGLTGNLTLNPGHIDILSPSGASFPTLVNGQARIITDTVSGLRIIGKGSTREFLLQTSAGANAWQMTASGHWQAGDDNTYDIGASGANRPRIGYFGTSVISSSNSGGLQAAFLATSSSPYYAWNNTAAGADSKRWDVNATTTTLNFRTVNDADSDSRSSLVIVRSGLTVTQYGFHGGATSGEQFRIATVSAAVNFIQAQGAATLGNVILSAQGTDSNIGFVIAAKGNAGVALQGNSATQLVTGQVASTTTWVTVSGSSTGAPTISVSGGALRLGDGTPDIIWGKANVALGGGAAPTVGTIGGSGPAAAAQRNWLRFIETDGTASFIPVWR